MKVVILAGGRGTRISEESHLRPKPMVTIGDKPILWHIMKIYASHGMTDFIICLGYRGYVIKEYFANYALHAARAVTLDLSKPGAEFQFEDAEPWRVTLVETGLETQTGGRLKRIAKWVENEPEFCLTYGDGLADVNITELIAFHRNHEALATVTAVEPAGRFGMLEVEGDQVTRFSEKTHAGNSFINGGYFVLSPKVIDYIADDTTIWERDPLERISAEGQLRAFHHKGFWKPMDTIREREELESMWSTGRPPWQIW